MKASKKNRTHHKSVLSIMSVTWFELSIAGSISKSKLQDSHYENKQLYEWATSVG